MSEEERRDWLTMKQTLETYLFILERQLVEFAANGHEEEFFPIRKAVEYKEVIASINELLKKDGL